MDRPHPLSRAIEPRERARALVRLGVFLCIAVALVATALWLLLSVLHVHRNADVAPPIATLLGLQLVSALTAVVIPSAVMMLATREPVASFGWGGTHRARQFALGVGVGLGLMSALIGLIWIFGGITIRMSGDTFGALMVHGLGYALVFVVSGINEEGLVRGYALVQLSRALSFWPAALISSLCFLLLHLQHQTETLIGLMQAGLAGLVLAYSFWRSGALWFALGWHTAWDFTETYIYGVPDSGMSARGSLLVSQLHGPVWLTGGTAGPEGSWFALAMVAITALLARFALNAGAGRISTPRE